MDKVRDFKNASKLYYYHKERIHYLLGRLEVIKQYMSRIKSPNFSNENQGMPAHTLMEYFDEEATLIKELHKHQFNVEWVDSVLKVVSKDTLLILKKVYINKTHTYEMLAEQLYRSDRKLKQRVDDELLKVLKNGTQSQF